MAQVGCFVPADAATFRPADRIFARVNSDDNMEYDASAFVLEVSSIIINIFNGFLTETVIHPY